MRYVGKSIPKIDGMAITTGKPVYTDDLAPQNALVVKVLHSPHAFARIKTIDSQKATALDGVECILTYQDVPNVRFSVAGQSYPEPSPYDRLILEDIVRYVGDQVAVVAAVDEETAQKALKLIKVDYEVFEPVLDFEKAEGHKSVIHPEKDLHCNYDIGMQQEKNIVSFQLVEVGNVTEELAKCEVVVEETCYSQACCHAMMETYRAFSYLDHLERLVVVSSTQIPFHVRRILARALELPPGKIRVVKPRIGGGFGGKQTAVVEMLTALVTLKTGKPAKLVYDRKETFSCTNSRHAMRLKVSLGADKDGLIRTIDMQGLSDTGAYGEHASTVFSVVGQKTLPLYNKANAVRFMGNVVYTNKVPAGAFRGYGATQGTFALETAVNKLAEKLKMDPAELRLKNLIQEGEKSLVFITEELGSSALHACIEKGKELIGWDAKYPSKNVGDNKVRAVGMAVSMQGSGIAGIDTASAEIRLNDDGSYTLLVGSTDMGTGSDTILKQMAADVLQAKFENITVVAADTDFSPFDPGSYASSTTYVTGMAVVKAAGDLVEQIKESGAALLGISAREVEFDGETVGTAAGDSKISLQEIAAQVVVGPGKRQLVGNATHGSDISPPPFIAGFAEVEVDKETGRVDLVDYVAVVDCGVAINPNLAKIQTEGGLVQGIGMALCEDVRYTNKGKMATNSFLQYKIPSRKDLGSIRVFFEASHEPSGPFGAKSIGEVVTSTPAPAIVHAVYNAVGIRITDLPITPEKVFCRMQES